MPLGEGLNAGLQALSIVITLLLAFLGFAVGAWKLISYLQAKEVKDAKDTAAAAQAKANETEKDLLRLQAALPLDYVRREDWIRNQTVIEAKLDGLAARLETIKEGRNGC